jgi:hypothetical protein
MKKPLRVLLMLKGLHGAGGGSSLLDGLTFYANLDEASGNRSTQVSGLTLTDNNTVGSTAGKVGNAARFVSASSESLSHANNPVFDIGSGAFTLSFWHTRNAAISGFDVIIGKDGDAGAGGTRDWVFYTDGTGLFTFQLYDDADSSVLTLTSAALPTQAWRHFVVTSDGSTVSMYVDNVLSDADSILGTPNSSASAFRIGSNDAGTHYIDGDVDEVGIWDRVLTDDEITELYNAGAGLAYPFS